MPELIEVEHSRRLLSRHALGKIVKRITVADDDKVICGNVSDLSSLTSKTVKRIERVGKNLSISFSDTDLCVCFHQGMTGAFTVRGHEDESILYQDFTVDSTSWPPKHCKLELETLDGVCFAFTNSRRFGRVRIMKEPFINPPISKLGPDVLNEMVSLSTLNLLLKKRKATIKGLLLNQSILAGLGNWMTDEILFQARIHPSILSNKLSDDQIKNLHASICYVVGTGCCPEVDASSERFPKHWLFHSRWKKTSERSRSVIFEKVGGRTSAIVKSVQKKTPSNLPPVYEEETDMKHWKNAISFVLNRKVEEYTNSRKPVSEHCRWRPRKRRKV
eukprot:g5946.t1